MSTVVAFSLGASDKAAGLQRARLKLFDPKPGNTGGADALGAERGAVEFQFNPKELSLTKSAKWERQAARNGSKAGPVQFTGAEPAKLTLEMFFDDTEKHEGSVVASVETLLSCCVPTSETRDQKKSLPPLVVFSWGAITGFPAFVSQVSAKYTLFSSDGTPLRATCSVSLEEVSGEVKGQNPTSGALAVRRHHTVVAGDSLASLAYAEYGDPTMWRALAAYNRVDDPLRLRPGTDLLVPAPEDLLPARA